MLINFNIYKMPPLIMLINTIIIATNVPKESIKSKIPTKKSSHFGTFLSLIVDSSTLA